MSGAAVRVGRLIALSLLAAALPLAGSISIAAANTSQQKTLRPPTLLWKSYPLEQRPSATEHAQAGSGGQPPRRQRSPGAAQEPAPQHSPGAAREAAPQPSPEVQPFPNALLVSALLAILVAMAAIVLMQSSVPARVGGLVRTRDGAQRPGPVRGPSDTDQARRTRPRPPLRDVAGRPVAEPHTPPTQPVVSEPDDDLLEALHPTPPSAPEREPEPEQRDRNPAQERARELPRELQLRSLVERMHAAAGPEREQLERELELLHERIKARPPSEPARRRDQEPPTFIREAHAVREPDLTGTTRKGPPPDRRAAHQTRASVETCEIRLWRGYVKCQLYATIRGSGDALAVSRYFRLRDQDTPSADALRALADLLAELERDGWTVVSDRPVWYQHRLQRSAASLGDRP
jgi:hypothetical protein